MDELRYRRAALWNSLASLFFLCVLAIAYSVVQGSAAALVLYRLNATDLVLVALAGFRLTRLVVKDKIFAFARAWFEDVVDGVSQKPHGGMRRTIAELIECPWCVGLWATLVALVCYVAGPFLHFLMLVLALSGAAMALYSFANLLGRVGK